MIGWRNQLKVTYIVTIWRENKQTWHDFSNKSNCPRKQYNIICYTIDMLYLPKRGSPRGLVDVYTIQIYKLNGWSRNKKLKKKNYRNTITAPSLSKNQLARWIIPLHYCCSRTYTNIASRPLCVFDMGFEWFYFLWTLKFKPYTCIETFHNE